MGAVKPKQGRRWDLWVRWICSVVMLACSAWFFDTWSEWFGVIVIVWAAHVSEQVRQSLAYRQGTEQADHMLEELDLRRDPLLECGWEEDGEEEDDNGGFPHK